MPIAAPPEYAAAFGDGRESALLVAGVEADSPAAKAGIAVGDILAYLGGRPLSDPSELMAALEAARPGVELAIVVLRSGEKKELTAIPIARDRGEGRQSGYRGHHGHRGYRGQHGPWWMGGGRCGWAPGR